ncbi:hypothetical protein SUDANB126_06946 [Streptomyces sp. enrichment culture]
MPGRDHLRGHLGLHLAAVAADVRAGRPTVYRRFAQWIRERVWARLRRVILDELGARGELDWSRCAIDSVSLRAAKEGP